MTQSQDAMVRIAEALELPASFSLQPETLIADVPGWDSYGWIAVMSALEETFAIEFPVDDIDTIRTVGDLLAAVDGVRKSGSSVR